MEEDELILVQALERETSIVYSFLISRNDGWHILNNEGKKMIEIEGGYVDFKDDGKVEIKQHGRAFLDADEVLRQLNEQLYDD